MRVFVRAAAVLGLAAATRLWAQRPVIADPSPGRVTNPVQDPTVPPTTLLYQNFPNPFPAMGMDSTCLSFDLATAADVELDILDLRGAPVRRLVPGPGVGPHLEAGRYGRSATGGAPCDARFTWDGRAEDGRVVPAGVYVFKLRAGPVIQFRRIVFRGRNS